MKMFYWPLLVALSCMLGGCGSDGYEPENVIKCRTDSNGTQICWEETVYFGEGSGK